MSLFQKACGCGFKFTATARPPKESSAECPGCHKAVRLGDAKELTGKPPAENTTKEE